MAQTSTKMLEDGFSTIITLQNIPTVKLYEKEVTPPGFSGGGAIDLTNMRSLGWRTAAGKQLKSQTPVTATVAYATESIPLIKDQISVNQIISVRNPDGSRQEFWGFLDEFTPGSNVEGEQPTATITVIYSGRNTAGEEVEPAYYSSPVDTSGE